MQVCKLLHLRESLLTCVDIYCYECNDARLDLDLAAHLSIFGINVSTQTKTEKTMTEMVRDFGQLFLLLLTDECPSSKLNTTLSSISA